MDRVTARRDAPRRIREILAATPGGCSVRELAGAANLHENAVRRALATLVAQEDVLVEPGRSSARGRPRLRYRLVGAADQPFKAVLPLLLELLGQSAASQRTAYATGYAHGSAAPSPGSGGASEALFASLAQLGFAPVEQPGAAPAGTVLDLTRCPFRDAVTGSENGPLICHLHHGLLAGIAAANDGELGGFVIRDPAVAPCRVLFHDLAERAPARV